jgi:tetratricopeptide (TPR) repeat protein
VSRSRPRSHQLEAESEVAFRAAIPSRWVFRRKSDDYGIDGEVEIFDANGKSTGDLFLVQLKATDETRVSKALQMRFRREVIRYYASLPLPLLLVKYHAPAHQLFFKWFHALDSYYARKAKATISFDLQETDRWTETSAARVEQTVSAFRQVRHPSPMLPIKFSVLVDADRVYGIPRYELQAMLRRSLERVRGMIELQFDGIKPGEPNQIEISDKAICVRLAHMPIFTLHTQERSFARDRSSALPDDILVILGLGLDWIGHSSLGADLIGATQPGSSVVRNPEIAGAIARCYWRAGRVIEGLKIAERLIDDVASIPVAHIYLALLATSVSEPRATEAVAILERMATSLGSRGYMEAAAALNYNCANISAQCGKYGEAVLHFRQARRLDPTYTQRSYYEREVGGTRFLMGRFRSAAFHYQRALQLDSDRRTRLLLADALLFSGAYERARISFDEVLGTGHDLSEAEWTLKSVVLPRIIAGAGQKSQVRRSRSLSIPFCSRATPDDEVRRLFSNALQGDALCARAWFNLGGVANRAGEHEEAMYSFLVAALIMRGDVEAWANAIGIALNSNRSVNSRVDGANEIAVLGMATAYMMNGENFLLHMAERVSESNREQFVTMIRALIAEIPNESEPAKPVIRVLGPDGTQHEWRTTLSETTQRT